MDAAAAIAATLTADQVTQLTGLGGSMTGQGVAVPAETFLFGGTGGTPEVNVYAAECSANPVSR